VIFLLVQVALGFFDLQSFGRGNWYREMERLGVGVPGEPLSRIG
jgi:hypothetical protein